MNYKFQAIITARGGSKGLPNKNLLPLGGIPLIGHTVLAALGSKTISECYVSTESPAISAVALKFGAKIIKRPLALAGDNTTSSEVVLHALSVLKAKKQLGDYFVLLQPTSPFRTATHIDEAVKGLLARKASSSMSVASCSPHPYKTFCMVKNSLKPLFDEKYLNLPRQLLPQVFSQNGAIYICDSQKFIKSGKFFIKPCVPYFMDEGDSVDIDTELDYVFAKTMLIAKSKLR